MTAKAADHHHSLRTRGIRATPQRVKLLSLLERANKPLGIPEIKALPFGRRMDAVTLYRGLETLARAKLIRQVDLRHGHADYEFVSSSHHHHFVCTSCGDTEDFDYCPEPSVASNALAKSKKFKLVTDHAVELFGVCVPCAKQT